MSRSGYSDNLDYRALCLYRGAVASAIRGARGQALLREMVAALDAMPVKRLIRNELVTADGQVCALGAVAQARGMDVSGIDPEDATQVAEAFGVAYALAAEIEFENDDDFSYGCYTTPEQRWEAMRKWAVGNIIERAVEDAP